MPGDLRDRLVSVADELTLVGRMRHADDRGRLGSAMAITVEHP